MHVEAEGVARALDRSGLRNHREGKPGTTIVAKGVVSFNLPLSQSLATKVVVTCEVYRIRCTLFSIGFPWKLQSGDPSPFLHLSWGNSWFLSWFLWLVGLFNHACLPWTSAPLVSSPFQTLKKKVGGMGIGGDGTLCEEPDSNPC
ncbi:hypothetical protein OIU84_021938 [Salix udensis]|uniref:Uncharacterized protein n=1 Tax=Salix udensis TaxID=889485 RepID=A0AAD6PIT5_9ROSI|nr:hypothetical protein OIU84_021938 [Salix udensis]